MRALVVSNMLGDAAHPERGRFVRDQFEALAAAPGVQAELFEFAPGPMALAQATRALNAAYRDRFDVVHAHFGLTAWPALAVKARIRALTLHGTDVRHPRTRLATLAALRFVDVLGVASDDLAATLPQWARRRAVTLPCGVDVERFRPRSRAQARAELGLPADRACLLFPADPARAEKRHDRAVALARATGADLHVLGGVAPEAVPAWVNAANAVVIPSEREGFGLAALEALACDVPVLATPVGIHEEALAGVAGTLCAPYEEASWCAALAPHLAAADPRVAGRARAEAYSATRMADAVIERWRAALARSA